MGLVLGAMAALVVLGIEPTLQAKRALVEAAGPYALAAAIAGLLAYFIGIRPYADHRNG